MQFKGKECHNPLHVTHKSNTLQVSADAFQCATSIPWTTTVAGDRRMNYPVSGE